MGILPALIISILMASLSTQVTLLPNSAKQAPLTSPTYPVPITAMCMFVSTPGSAVKINDEALYNARRQWGMRNERFLGAAFGRRRLSRYDESEGRHAAIMKIVDAKVIVCCPGRNFVTLKLTTEDGVYGLGDATLNGRELAVASYLNDHLLPLLIGRDARRIEDTWQYLYKGAYWRRGPVTMTAIAAVDTALWDILGKTT